MNLGKLREVIKEKSKLTPAELIASGVKETQVVKVRVFMSAILEHDQRIAKSSEAVNKSLAEIERYVGLLNTYGMNIRDEEKKEEPPKPVEATVPPSVPEPVKAEEPKQEPIKIGQPAKRLWR